MTRKMTFSYRSAAIVEEQWTISTICDWTLNKWHGQWPHATVATGYWLLACATVPRCVGGSVSQWIMWGWPTTCNWPDVVLQQQLLANIPWISLDISFCWFCCDQKVHSSMPASSVFMEWILAPVSQNCPLSTQNLCLINVNILPQPF